MQGSTTGAVPDLPDQFSVAPVHQEVPRTVLGQIEAFVRTFDRITTSEAWQRAATADGPPIARTPRPEVCFFSAWDFHVPSDRPDRWKLIELNDNGSGFLFAALLDQHHYELAGLAERGSVEPPATYAALGQRLVGMIRAEAEAFFGTPLRGLVLLLDDAHSLERGRFLHELALLCELCRAEGWRAEIASPAETTWNGEQLLCRGEPVTFVVNRSTDFLWEGPELGPLRSAYESRSVYVAPNPFTYATRSDKRLLAWLSTPARDAELGIRPEERAVLGAHVPETRVLRAEDVDELAATKDDWFFKPCHGFASHGVLPGAEVGRDRLRRMLKKGTPYVAQRVAPKTHLVTADGTSLWADLRVWAYRGERYLLSGRASRRPDRLDLTPPGGWLATYVTAEEELAGLTRD